MKKLLFAIPALMMMAFVIPVKELYVPYADAKARMEQAPYNDANVMRIYFDRQGFIYPDHQLTDVQVRNNSSLLKLVYFNDPKLYGAICAEYNVKPKADVENLSTENDPLQDAMIQSLSARINKAAKNYTKLVFLVHGADKAPMVTGGSGSDFDLMKTSVSNRLPGERVMFVEIYWDGCYDANGISNMENMWTNAQISSCNTGLELRRIFNKLRREKTYVITHSLGANVATTALFNVHMFRGTPETNTDLAFEKLYDNAKYQTPAGVYKVGLIAPSVPGENTFDDYYERTARPQQMNYNNYRFVIAFNNNDETLRKFVSSPDHLSNTTLGCQDNQVYSLINRFNRDVFDTTDFSKNTDGTPMTSHSVEAYTGADAFNRFATNLFQN